MKKPFVGLFFAGFSVGITIGNLVNLIISAAIGDGSYLPVMPQMTAYFQNQWTAVFVFTLWMGAIGVAFAEASQIFAVGRLAAWQQYLLHFLVTGVVYLPFLWVCYLPKRLSSVFLMLGNILLSYGITWGMQYRASKRQIARINAALKGRKTHGGN